MGWTYFSKPESVKDWFRGEYGGEDSLWKHEVLDVAIVNMNELYAAIKRTHKESGESYVWAAVFLLKFTRGYSYNFGYKDMDESMGPYCINCPEKILNLLTPTNSEESIKWRQACRDRIAARKALPKVGLGNVLKLYFYPELTITGETKTRWLLSPGHYHIGKRALTNRLLTKDAVIIKEASV